MIFRVTVDQSDFTLYFAQESNKGRSSSILVRVEIARYVAN